MPPLSNQNRRHSTHRILRDSILFSLLLSFFQHPQARASVLLEPLAGLSIGKSSLPSATATTSFGFGAGVRAGIQNEKELFSAVEARYQLVGLSGTGTGGLFTAGVTVGMTMVQIPIRLTLGFDLADSYSDSVVTMTGTAFRLGLSYYFTEELLFNFDFSRHLFSSFSSKSSALSKLTSASFTSYGLSVSIPFNLEPPSTPWRVRYRQKKAMEEAKKKEEALTAPDSMEPESAPEGLPETPAEAPSEMPSEIPPETPVEPLPETAPELPPADAPPADAGMTAPPTEPEIPPSPDAPPAPDSLPAPEALPAPQSLPAPEAPPAPDALPAPEAAPGSELPPPPPPSE